MVKETGRKMIAQNKKARHDYHIEDTYEAGLMLMGTEVKALIQSKGVTVIPLSLYFKDGRAKVEIALARGKKSHDKRHAIAERQATRDAEREVGRRLKGL